MPHDNGDSDDDDGVHEYGDVHVFERLLYLHLCQMCAPFLSIRRPVAWQDRDLFPAVDDVCGNERLKLVQCSLVN